MNQHYALFKIILKAIAIISICSVIYFGFGYKWFLPKGISQDTDEKGEVTFTIPKKGTYTFHDGDGYVTKIIQNGKELSTTSYQSTVYKGTKTKNRTIYPENPTFDIFQAEKGTIHVFTKFDTTTNDEIERVSLTLSKHVNEEFYFWGVFISIFTLAFSLIGTSKTNKK